MSVVGILVGGQDVFYSSDETTLVANAEDIFPVQKSPNEFEKELLSKMAVPKRKSRITFSQDVPDGVIFVLPYDYQVLRVGK